MTSVDGAGGRRSASARERRNEGLMVKDPRSIYSPGRRGLGWLKMKKALATIDCVVVGVEVGHGKRHGVLSDYTFAVRDTEQRQAGQDRQGVQRPDRRRDRRDDPLVRGPHDRPLRPLSAGRADRRRRGRVRRDRPVEPAPVRATRSDSRGSRTSGPTRRPTRSTRSRRSTRVVRGTPAGRRTARHRGRASEGPARVARPWPRAAGEGRRRCGGATGWPDRPDVTG